MVFVYLDDRYTLFQGEDVGCVGRRQVINCFYTVRSNRCGPIFMEPRIRYSGSGVIVRDLCFCILVRILGADFTGEIWREPEKNGASESKRHFLRKKNWVGSQYSHHFQVNSIVSSSSPPPPFPSFAPSRFSGWSQAVAGLHSVVSIGDTGRRTSKKCQCGRVEPLLWLWDPVSCVLSLRYSYLTLLSSCLDKSFFLLKTKCRWILCNTHDLDVLPYFHFQLHLSIAEELIISFSVFLE